MKSTKIYRYGENPLSTPTNLIEGEIYVSSAGNVLQYMDNGEFKTILYSLLSDDIFENTMENLTELQLELFWTLSKNLLYEYTSGTGEQCDI